MRLRRTPRSFKISRPHPLPWQFTDQVARLACGAVANASEDSSTHKYLLSRTNAMHYMVFLMRSRHLSVHREASRACGNLLTGLEAHQDFVSEVRRGKYDLAER